MKTISISALFVILIVFCSPLLSIKDTYKNMEYEQIGDSMLGSVQPFINTLDTTASAAEEGIDFLKNTLSVISEAIDSVSGFLKTIRDFVIGLFEDKTGYTCNPNEAGDGGFTCGTSEGGGGGSFGGGNR